jgi:hypothetical protein
MALADARKKLEAWRRYYNEERPHGRLGISHRYGCTTTMTLPARRREYAGKPQLIVPLKWSDLKCVFWHRGGPRAEKTSQTEEIVAKLRQVDVLT